MVVKFSSVGLMHILVRTSPSMFMSHALAWQTTSRSSGLMNWVLSQYDFGSVGMPSET
ncbi:hypothetical protein D3C71_1517320 [compost metagenome]